MLSVLGYGTDYVLILYVSRMQHTLVDIGAHNYVSHPRQYRKAKHVASTRHEENCAAHAGLFSRKQH